MSSDYFNTLKEQTNDLLAYVGRYRDTNLKRTSLVTSQDGMCSVCFQNFKVGDDIPLMNCKHMFHLNCLREWFKYQRNCPMCRADKDYYLYLVISAQSLRNCMDVLDIDVNVFLNLPGHEEDVMNTTTCVLRKIEKETRTIADTIIKSKSR